MAGMYHADYLTGADGAIPDLLSFVLKLIVRAENVSVGLWGGLGVVADHAPLPFPSRGLVCCSWI